MENKKSLNDLKTKVFLGYELIIFDFDGTITEPLPVDWQNLKKKLHIILNKDYDKKNTMDKLLYNIKSRLGETGLEKAYKIIDEYEKKAVPLSRINRNFLEIVNMLPKNIKKAIFSTNMKNTINNILSKNNLVKVFNIIISKEDVQKYKPDPQGLMMILNSLQVNSSKAIYIGNSIVDQIAGNNAKIETIIL